MAATVIFHRLASKDYLQGLRWYARRSPRVGLSFRNEVARAVAKIAENPQRWPIYRTHFRWVRTHRFPWVLYYHMIDDQTVLVVAVAHGRRRLDYWKRRFRD